MNETDRMQADAVSRAKDMYRRSQGYNANSLPNGYNGSFRDTRPTNNTHNNNNNNNKGNTNSSPAEEIISEIAEEAIKEAIEPNHKSQSKGLDIFESLLQDKERTLIILLIILLSEEKANTSLVLALMYLIM